MIIKGFNNKILQFTIKYYKRQNNIYSNIVKISNIAVI